MAGDSAERASQDTVQNSIHGYSNRDVSESETEKSEYPRVVDLGDKEKSPASHQSSTSDSASFASASEWVELIYQSREMHELVAQTRKFAQSSATVLLCGESGTGKELFAKMVHNYSNRRGRRFVRVNCAALSESLLESEFFGHERGAFTGAIERRIGRFEWADGGTILLDEVSEIPVQLQAKLLRVLEENELQRVGSNLDQKIDVRVIATSNRNLQSEVAKGNFRNDLYHRLNVLQLNIPELRNRASDIGILAQRFVEQFASDSKLDVRGISKSALRRLESYSWPGNVRQLRNAVHRACVLTSSEWLAPEDFSLAEEQAEAMPAWLVDQKLSEIERLMILTNLDRFNGNKTATANHLGVTSRTLANKMKIYKSQGAA